MPCIYLSCPAIWLLKSTCANIRVDLRESTFYNKQLWYQITTRSLWFTTIYVHTRENDHLRLGRQRNRRTHLQTAHCSLENKRSTANSSDEISIVKPRHHATVSSVSNYVCTYVGSCVNNGRDNVTHPCPSPLCSSSANWWHCARLHGYRIILPF